MYMYMKIFLYLFYQIVFNISGQDILHKMYNLDGGYIEYLTSNV